MFETSERASLFAKTYSVMILRIDGWIIEVKGDISHRALSFEFYTLVSI